MFGNLDWETMLLLFFTVSLAYTANEARRKIWRSNPWRIPLIIISGGLSIACLGLAIVVHFS